MAFSNRRVLPRVCFFFMLLFSVLPVVRASYSTAAWRLQRAFANLALPLLPSAGPTNQTLLDAHDTDLYDSIINYEELEMNLVDGEPTAVQQQELDEAFKNFERAYFQIIADYMGVGWPTACQEQINMALKAASEWDKAGQQAATTLMALLPLLLTFGMSHFSTDQEWENSHIVRQSLCTTKL